MRRRPTNLFFDRAYHARLHLAAEIIFFTFCWDARISSRNRCVQDINRSVITYMIWHTNLRKEDSLCLYPMYITEINCFEARNSNKTFFTDLLTIWERCRNLAEFLIVSKKEVMVETPDAFRRELKVFLHRFFFFFLFWYVYTSLPSSIRNVQFTTFAHCCWTDSFRSLLPGIIKIFVYSVCQSDYFCGISWSPNLLLPL